jgi:hypothetical protein
MNPKLNKVSSLSSEGRKPLEDDYAFLLSSYLDLPPPPKVITYLSFILSLLSVYQEIFMMRGEGVEHKKTTVKKRTSLTS